MRYLLWLALCRPLYAISDLFPDRPSGRCHPVGGFFEDVADWLDDVLDGDSMCDCCND